MKKIQVIDLSILQIFDRLCIFLSLGYILFFFLGDIEGTLAPFFSVGLIAISIYLAKVRNKVLYSAVGYALFSLLMIDIVVGNFDDITFKPSFIFIPFIIFLTVMIIEWNSNFLSGFLYGYWAVFIYEVVKNFGDVPILGFLEAAYSPEQFYYLITQHFGVIMLIGIIFTLIGKNQSFDFNGYWIEKVDYTFFLMSSGYFVMWVLSGFVMKYLFVLLVYGVLTHFNLQAKATGKSTTSAFTYGAATFLLAYAICQLFQVESIIPPIIVAIIVSLIVLKLKISTSGVTFLLGVYWVLIFYQMWKAAPSSWGEGLLMIFHLNSIQQLSQYVNFIGIALALFVFGNFMIQRQKKTAKK